MKRSDNEKEYLIKAKKRSRKIMLFYVHLIGYIVFVSLMVYNLYIVEEYYKNEIISLNLSVIVAWSVFIVIHGVVIFKGRQIFKKSWEDRKIDQFLKEKGEVDTGFWE